MTNTLKGGIATRFGRQIQDVLIDLPQISFALDGKVGPSASVGFYNDVSTNQTNLVGISADKYPNDRWALCTRAVVRDEGDLAVYLATTASGGSSPDTIDVIVPAGHIYAPKSVQFSWSGGTVSTATFSIMNTSGSIISLISASAATITLLPQPIFVPAGFRFRYQFAWSVQPTNFTTRLLYQDILI